MPSESPRQHPRTLSGDTRISLLKHVSAHKFQSNAIGIMGKSLDKIMSFNSAYGDSNDYGGEGYESYEATRNMKNGKHDELVTCVFD